jgi:hypothetical protein
MHSQCALPSFPQWAGGLGSFHPDYDPEASEDFRKAKRETEELYNAIVKNDVTQVGNGTITSTTAASELPRSEGNAWSDRLSQQTEKWFEVNMVYYRSTRKLRRAPTSTSFLDLPTLAPRDTRPSWLRHTAAGI